MSKDNIHRIQIGDSIKIRWVDKYVTRWFKNSDDIKWLRALFALNSKEYYKVVDICRNCRIVYIVSGKHRFNIKSIHVTNVRKNKTGK